MAITVTFYRISKRVNSTRRTETASGVYSCNVRDGCGVLYPEIEILDSMSFNPSTFTHFEIPAFGRLYWITEAKFLNRKWFVTGKVDVLATYKAQILASTHFVLRSSSEQDPAITDNQVYRKCFTRYAITSADTGFYPPTFIQEGGSFVVGVVGKGGSSAMVTYYVLSVSQMVELRDYLLSMDEDDIYADWETAGQEDDSGGEPNTGSGSGSGSGSGTGTGSGSGSSVTATVEAESAKITAGAVKALLNPFQYIVSCMWFPFAVNTGASDTVKFGFWDSGISAGIVDSNYAQRFEFIIQRPNRHDHDTIPGMYVYAQPFANLTLYCPPFESIELPGGDLGFTACSCFVMVDLITGSATLVARQRQTGVPQMPILGQRSAQIGVPLQISQITTDYIGAISAGFGGWVKTAAAIGYDLGSKLGEIMGTGAKYSGLLNGQLSEAKIAGAAGGFAGLQLADKAYLILRYTDITEVDNAHAGKPLCKLRALGQLSGFCLCRDGEVEAAATEEELSQISDFLTSGFFIDAEG